MEFIVVVGGHWATTGSLVGERMRYAGVLVIRGMMMRRREFIAGLGSGAAWPVSGRAQQSMPVVGLLVGTTVDFTSEVVAFRQGLNEIGYVEGRNVMIEYRSAEGHFDRLPALAAELVERKVDVLVSSGGALVAATAATKTIPVVAFFASDPAKSGLVASDNRPGGNVTGVNMMAQSLGPKRFEVLHELLPKANLIAVLANPTIPNPAAKADLNDVVTTAREVGQQLSVFHASTEGELEPAFATMAQWRANGLLVTSDPFFASRREQLVLLAARYAIPAIYEWREYASEGGLMSYGASLKDASRRLGIYAGQVLKGAKPADMPIEQSVKIELILNMKTAKSLRVTFPLTLLGRADEVIE